MVRNNKIEVESIGYQRDRVFYKVGSGDNRVSVSMVGNEVISCTCKASRIHGLGEDCSYVLAVRKFRRRK